MPELPEVETVRRRLDNDLSRLPGTVREVKLWRPDLRVPFPQGLAQKLKGQKVLSVRRRAKYLLFDTENHTLISHLGMTGSWRWVNKKEKKKHDHCFLHFEDGRCLAYHDPRRFGFFDLVSRGQETKSPWIEHLGFEPLSAECTAEKLLAMAQKRQGPIKNFIMDQKILVGVGNIYASEALFLSKIKPTRRAGSLKLKEWQLLLRTIQKVLKKSIESEGTTLRDYVQPDGERGEFQNQLFVYGREGEKCRKCSTHIKLKKLAGRSTFWCESCQK